MSAFDEWYNAIDPDERPDHTDAMAAFNASMTQAARVCNNRAIRLTLPQRPPYYACATAIIAARDSK